MKSTQSKSQSKAAPYVSASLHAGVLQRKCDCGNHNIAGGHCGACGKKHQSLQRVAENSQLGGRNAELRPPNVGLASQNCGGVPPIVHEVLRSPGRPLDAATRAFMEPRFGYDFSRVRVHTDVRAAKSAEAVSALAYTVGQNVVLAAGSYSPESARGRDLLAHELTHTIQQRGNGEQIDQGISLGDPDSASEHEAENAVAQIARNQRPQLSSFASPSIARVPCTSAAVCAPPAGVAGSARQFGTTEADREAASRQRRQRMTPPRAVSTGHAGHARQLEIFLQAQRPGRLAEIQGVFIDQDLSPGTEALTESCPVWITEGMPGTAPTPPGMGAATRDCTFVHDRLNQQALAFNTTADPIIGGVPREVWRVHTLQTLVHETEHPRFEAAQAARPLPAGVTSPTCNRSQVFREISEIAAGLSEFPPIFRSAAAEANPLGPVHRAIANWFPQIIRTGGENFVGALRQMGCACACPEVDAFVIDTFNEVTTSGGWTVPEKNAFNARLRVELPPPGPPRWPL